MADLENEYFRNFDIRAEMLDFLLKALECLLRCRSIAASGSSLRGTRSSVTDGLATASTFITGSIEAEVSIALSSGTDDKFEAKLEWWFRIAFFLIRGSRPLEAANEAEAGDMS